MIDRSIAIREMHDADRAEVAALIYESTNDWYESHGKPPIFTGGRDATELFFDVYHALPGSGGVVAVDEHSSALVGSCFVHDRPTHMSLGIMNAHPKHFGCGIARKLLQHIIDQAEQKDKPLRLVSSAMNLDSFSLYTRFGFVPRRAYQDMLMTVPKTGLVMPPSDVSQRVRDATLDDLNAIGDLEFAVSGIRRESDYAHFISNREGYWHVSIVENAQCDIQGVLASCGHRGCNMLGPGVAKEQSDAVALIIAELNQHRGRSPVFLVPVDCGDLVASMYAIGARNCEMHFAQVRGFAQPFAGVNMPSFMPETG